MNVPDHLFSNNTTRYVSIAVWLFINHCLFFIGCLCRYNRGCTSLREEDSATLISEALRKKFVLKEEETACIKK